MEANEAELRRRLESAREHNDSPLVVTLAHALACHCIQRGLIQAARSVLQLSFDHAGATNSASLIASTWRYAAVVELLARERELAQEMLEEAQSWSDQDPLLGSTLRTQILAACVQMRGMSVSPDLDQIRALSHSKAPEVKRLELYRLTTTWLVCHLGANTMQERELEELMQWCAQPERMLHQDGGEILSEVLGGLWQESRAPAIRKWPAKDLSASEVLGQLALQKWEAVEVAVSMELLRKAARRAVTLELSGGSIPLVVGADRAAWFEVDGGPRVDLLRRSALRNILTALLEQRLVAPHSGLNVSQMFDVGWPGEQVGQQSKRARVYVAIRELRELGLADVLVSSKQGYRLDLCVELRFTR